jgi:hypothetical protein
VKLPRHFSTIQQLKTKTSKKLIVHTESADPIPLSFPAHPFFLCKQLVNTKFLLKSFSNKNLVSIINQNLYYIKEWFLLQRK